MASLAEDPKPNIVLILMDNFGWGERGAATPRLDQFAAQGMRLLNFNVEAQCTPSCASLLTGRYAIRTGNSTDEWYGIPNSSNDSFWPENPRFRPGASVCQFMRRQTQERKPFFLYLPYTQTDMPVTPEPEFKGKTGNGDFADVLAQVDRWTAAR